MALTTAGDRLDTAGVLNITSTPQSVSDRVNLSSPNDYYRFTVGSRSSFNLTLSGLSANANLQLLNSSGSNIQTSANSGSLTESVNVILDSGTYYIRVYQAESSADTEYSLGVVSQSGIRKTDILWRDYTGGTTALWSMGGTNNASLVSSAGLTTVSPNWVAEAVADFNKDGSPDIVWRDYSTGKNGIWFMGGANNAAMISSTEITSVSTNWRIEGVADFNSDNRPDIFWRDYSTGQNGIWFMGGVNNTSLLSSTQLVTASSNWAVGGIADFNGDNRPDILWRDYSSGNNAIWFMGGSNGLAIVSTAGVSSVSTNWRIEGVADFNGDSCPDILWRDYSSGRNGVWLMGGVNNTAIVSSFDLQTVAANWQPIPYNRTGEATLIDQAGNAISTAFNVGTLNGSGAFSDRLGETDLNDFYRFNLTTASLTNFSLNSLVGNADIKLLDQSGNLIQASANSGMTPDLLNLQLAAGTYYIQIYAASTALTNYTLNLSATPANLDLQGTFFDATEPLTPGGSFNADFRIRNAGNTVSGAFRVGFYLSTDSAITTSDRFLGYYDIASLAANTTTATLTSNLILPGASDLFWSGSKTYYIGMVVDALNAITETNEANNASNGNGIDWDDVVVNLPQADLRGSFFDTPDFLTPGNNIAANFRVRNLGAGNAASFRVGFYLSTDSAFTAGDRLLGFRDITGLAAGGTSSLITQNLVLPGASDTIWSNGTGTYYIGMIVDSLNALSESNENNNANLGNGVDWDDVQITVVQPPPDLKAISFASTSQYLTAGGALSVNYQLQNAGTGNASSFRVAFYLSKDSTIATDDYFLGFNTIASLLAGASPGSLSNSFLLPANYDAFWNGDRTYYIGMMIDSLGVINESNEANNSNLGNGIDWDDVSITVPPLQADLRGSSFDVVTNPVTAGNAIAVNFQVQNAGLGAATAFRVSFYLSKDGAINTADYLLGNYDITSLAAGATTAVLTQNLTLPENTNAAWIGSGVYWIGMIVDSLNAVNETDETQNSNTGNGIDFEAVNITVPKTIDLKGVSFDATPEPLTSGNSFTANFQIQNTGNTSSGAFYVSFYVSGDNSISSSDQLLSSYYYSTALAGGATSAILSQTLTLPAGTDLFWNGSHTYYIGMIVDSSSVITESNETNNSNLGNGVDWDDVAIAVTTTVTAPTVATFSATGNLAMDALLSSYRNYWNTSANGGIITYSFLTSAAASSYYGTETVSEVNDAIKVNVRGILSSLESIINVRFVEVTDTATSYGVLRYMFSSGPSYAYAYYPTTNPVGGDVHLNSYYETDSYNRFSGGYGTHGYMSLIHETLHALGMKHPGDYNGSGTGEAPFLAGGDDNTTNTVMSYNFAGEAAITPMAYDMRVLQYLYGARGNNATVTTYSFSSVFGYSIGSQFFGSNSTALKQTIWDSGGVDTLDFSGLSTANSYYFDLREGGMLTTQSAYNSTYYTARGDGGYYATTGYGTEIAYNSTIENLVNSRGNDYIIANSANNVFKGYTYGVSSGSDTIEATSSSDTLELSGYSLANLTTTVSGSDLKISLGTNGSIQIKSYYGSSGSMRVLLGGSYYTYSATGGWQIAAAPTLPNSTALEPISSGGLTATTPIYSVPDTLAPVACNCPVCTGQQLHLTTLGSSTLANLIQTDASVIEERAIA